MLSFILKFIFIYLLITFVMFLFRFYKTIQGVKKQMGGHQQSGPFGGFGQRDEPKKTQKSSPQKGDVEVEYKVIKED